MPIVNSIHVNVQYKFCAICWEMIRSLFPREVFRLKSYSHDVRCVIVILITLGKYIIAQAFNTDAINICSVSPLLLFSVLFFNIFINMYSCGINNTKVWWYELYLNTKNVAFKISSNCYLKLIVKTHLHDNYILNKLYYRWIMPSRRVYTW